MSTAKIREFDSTIERMQDLYFVKIRVLKFDTIRQEWYWANEVFKAFNTKKTAERFHLKMCDELRARLID